MKTQTKALTLGVGFQEVLRGALYAGALTHSATVTSLYFNAFNRGIISSRTAALVIEKKCELWLIDLEKFVCVRERLLMHQRENGSWLRRDKISPAFDDIFL